MTGSQHQNCSSCEMFLVCSGQCLSKAIQGRNSGEPAPGSWATKVHRCMWRAMAGPCGTPMPRRVRAVLAGKGNQHNIRQVVIMLHFLIHFPYICNTIIILSHNWHWKKCIWSMTSGTVNSMHRHQRVKTEQTVLKLWKLVMTIDSNSANQVFLVAQGGPTPY